MFWCSAAAASAALAVAGHHPLRAHLLQLLPVSPAVLHLVQVASCPPAGHLGLLLHAALDHSTTGSSCEELPPHQQGKGCPSAEQQPTFRLRRRNHLHQPHRLFAHISPSSLPSITLTSSPTVSLALPLSEFVKSHKGALLQFSHRLPLSSPAAARPPCYVDSLFTCCPVKDSPRSVLWLHQQSVTFHLSESHMLCVLFVRYFQSTLLPCICWYLESRGCAVTSGRLASSVSARRQKNRQNLLQSKHMSSTLTKTFHVFPASIMTLYMKILVFKLISSWAPRNNQKGSLIYILQQMLPRIWAMLEMRNTAWDRTDPAPISKHQYTSGMTTTKASRSTITNSNNNKNNNEQTNAGNLIVMKALLLGAIVLIGMKYEL